MIMEELKKFPNVFMERKGKITSYFVKTNLNKSFFEERIVRLGGDLFKEVDPSRSKLFASIANNISQLGVKEDSTILYLGASHGYTVSFLSDVAKDGVIYALDFAPRVVRDLVFLCQERENIAPLMQDATRPNEYKDKVPMVDVVFMDIAQKEQVKIFLNNCDVFLKEGGFGILALKSRSVDVTKNPKDIFKKTRAELEQVMSVVDYKDLEPFEKDHAIFVCKRKDEKSISYENIKEVQLSVFEQKPFVRRSNYGKSDFSSDKPRFNRDDNRGFKRSSSSTSSSGFRGSDRNERSSFRKSSSSSNNNRKRY